MHINGLLLTLSQDIQLSSDAIEKLTSHPAIEVGERNQMWLPIVAEATGTRQSHEIHEWVESLAGVTKVDVIMASVEDKKTTLTNSNN